MAPVASSSKGQRKPYARPTELSKVSASKTDLGAPSQPGQSSRKGKKAWRKNIDIADIEEGLEQAREEERVTGGPVRQKTDAELFTIDTTGDVEVAKKLRRVPKPLRSLAVLNERSAVPSLSSRPVTNTKSSVSKAEKARLRRLRDALGPNATGSTSYAGPSKSLSAGQGLEDAWDQVEVPVTAPGGYGEEAMRKARVKTPKTVKQLRDMHVSHLEAERSALKPDGGVSYNPKAESHQRLIDLAVEEEKQRLEQDEALERLIDERGRAVENRERPLVGEDYVDGMVVGPGEPNADESEVEEVEQEEERVVRKMPGRKTQAQRNKALRAKEEARLAQLEKVKRQMLRDLNGAKGAAKSAEQKHKEMREAERLSRLAKRERERLGLQGGEKIGKHRIKKSAVEVQLGEDLAETLRQVKPEGNLFKDRFLALQKRGLVEPRVPQLPTRRRRKTIEYEKHAYKRFS